jgi:alkylated DNA repair dioxygenase AlkB
MGWHADDVTILAPGTPIAILSLGHERTLGLRCRADDGFH